jgi:hypothetical protein
MVGLNGGYDVDDGFYNCSIIDDEPILNFSAGMGYDVIASYSQIAKDYDIIKVNGGCGYLYPKSSSLKDIKDDFYNVKDGGITRKDVNYYDVYNYDLIVSYGDDNEGKEKARLWFKNKVLETTPKEKTKWILDNLRDAVSNHN